jgi:signal transduction histidine kinase
MLPVSLLSLVVITNVLLALFVLANNIQASLNRILCALSIDLALWSIVTYFEDAHLNSEVTHLLVRLDFLFASLLVMLFFWFCYDLTKSQHKNIFKANILGAVIGGALSISGSLVSVSITSDQVSFIEKPFYNFFLLYLAFGILGGLTLLITRYQNVSGKEKIQLQFVFFGFFLTSLAIITTNVILPNIVETPPTVTRLGIYSTLFLTGFMAYAIIRHHFMDFKLVVTRSVTYTLLLTALAGLYSGSFIFISKIFVLNNNGSGQYITSVILAVILAFIFQPLRRFFQRTTDNIFFRGGYDPSTLLGNLGSIMAREIELGRLTSQVIAELTSQMKLFKATIAVLDENGIFYETDGNAQPGELVSLEELKKIKSGVVLGDTSDSEEVKKMFDKYGFDLSVDLMSSNELVGFLLLSGKKSGDIFNSTDVRTLNILAHELALAIHNARSYTEIQNFNKTLQKRVDEATEQLRSANEHLKELDQLKNEFLSMATHQLNTPLTVVDGYLTLVNDGVVNEPAERRDYIEKTLERVRSMKRMVADFLDVSRIETGKFIIDVKPVDFNKLVSEEVNGLGPSAKGNGVLLQFIAPKHPLPLVEIDEQKTRQAVMNLIDNAIYYAPKGEVKVYLDSDEKFVTYKVVDNGIGVPENQKNKLFQKFYRADNARSERPNGNGVGLFLVKRVIEDQGGKIIFESTEGKGSTFGFTLPIKSNLPTESAETNSPGPDPQEPATG